MMTPNYSSHRKKEWGQNVLDSFDEALEMLEKGWEEGAIVLKGDIKEFIKEYNV